MKGDLRQWVSLALAAAGMSWWFGVEIWRGRSQEHSPRVFWLHLTAPLVGIVLMVAAILVLLGSEHFR